MRADGRRVRDMEAMYYLIPHILTHRYDAMNMITLDIPMEPLKKYKAEKRKEGYNLSYLGIILAAYLRTAAEYPARDRSV